MNARGGRGHIRQLVNACVYVRRVGTLSRVGKKSEEGRARTRVAKNKKKQKTKNQNVLTLTSRRPVQLPLYAPRAGYLFIFFLPENKNILFPFRPRRGGRLEIVFPS